MAKSSHRTMLIIVPCYENPRRVENFASYSGVVKALHQPIWSDLTNSNPFLLVVIVEGGFLFVEQNRGHEGAAPAVLALTRPTRTLTYFVDRIICLFCRRISDSNSWLRASQVRDFDR